MNSWLEARRRHSGSPVSARRVSYRLVTSESRSGWPRECARGPRAGPMA
jgi:hypothetical protein